jgi:hypothetical protein
MFALAKCSSFARHQFMPGLVKANRWKTDAKRRQNLSFIEGVPKVI